MVDKIEHRRLMQVQNYTYAYMQEQRCRQLL